MSYQQPDEARPAWMAERENEELKAEVAALKGQIARMAEALKSIADYYSQIKPRDAVEVLRGIARTALTPDATALAEAWKRGQEAERILGSLFDTADEYLTVQTGFANGLIDGDETVALLNLSSCIGERVVAFRRVALEGSHG